MKKNLIFLFLIFTLFWIKGIIFLDPDFGWHLRSGEIILSRGIPLKDPFSYTMPSYNFVNHEWLTGVKIAKLYPLAGMIGLAIVFSAIAVFSLIIQTFKLKQNFILPTLVLALTAVLSTSGVRPQIITWLFFSILLKIALDSKLWNKWKWFLPFIFLIWANMHGGFVIGIATLFLAIMFKNLKFIHFKLIKNFKLKIKNYSEFQSDIFIFFLCFLATFINPYGFNLWKEVWVSISDGSLRWSIAEWIPPLFVLDIAFWFYFAFSLVFVFLYRKKLGAAQLILYFGFLLAGLSSVRNIPFWILISLPLTVKAMELFYSEAESKKDGVLRFNKAYKVFFVIVLLISIIQIFFVFKASKVLSEESYYPKKAVEYLKNNPVKNQIFSQYGWGGYLIWKLPEKKVFIDGRMPSWRGHENKNESEYAFRDYKDIFAGKLKFKKVADKYNIDTVLLPAQKPESKKRKFLEDLDLWWNHFIERFVGKRKYPDIYTQLKKEGWKVVYKDEVSVIYKK